MLKWIASVVIVGCIAFPLYASEKKRSYERVVARFGGECEGEPFRPSAKLRRLIDKAKRGTTFPSQMPYGEKAFVYDLNGDGKPEYFVRLACGGTGNCTWGIFSDRPARLRGVVTAWFLYIYRRNGSRSSLTTYTRSGGAEGIIDRYLYRRGKYIHKFWRIEKGYPGNWQPFLKQMGLPECE